MSATATLVQPSPAATTWTIDASHTQVEFAVRHLMISTVRGRFSDVSGTITLPDQGVAGAKADVRIGVASIDTREPQRDAHLKSADFFEVDQFPLITFTSRRAESRGADAFQLVGDLTIHGVTREVALDVIVEGHGKDPWGNQRAGFSATTRISRKDFGLTWNQLLEAGGVAVGDEVKISIETELVKGA